MEQEGRSGLTHQLPVENPLQTGLYEFRLNNFGMAKSHTGLLLLHNFAPCLWSVQVRGSLTHHIRGQKYRSGHCRTSSASSRSQWALLDLNCELQISLGTAGPQPRVPDRSAQLRLPDSSGHCRTPDQLTESFLLFAKMNEIRWHYCVLSQLGACRASLRHFVRLEVGVNSPEPFSNPACCRQALERRPWQIAALQVIDLGRHSTPLGDCDAAQ
eukprot:s168_g30.t1